MNFKASFSSYLFHTDVLPNIILSAAWVNFRRVNPVSTSSYQQYGRQHYIDESRVIGHSKGPIRRRPKNQGKKKTKTIVKDF